MVTEKNTIQESEAGRFTYVVGEHVGVLFSLLLFPRNRREESWEGHVGNSRRTEKTHNYSLGERENEGIK